MLFSDKTIFLDVDMTLVNLKHEYNENFIQILKLAGVKEVYFLTRYAVPVEISITGCTRLAMIHELEKNGITVKGVLTPLDIALGQRPGDAYELMRPFDEAVEKLRADSYFGASDVVDQEERRQLIRDRFAAFKRAYNVSKDMASCPGITEANLPLMDALYRAHAEAFEPLQLNNSAFHDAVREISKGLCRNALAAKAIFIDDNMGERNTYLEKCPNDIVLRPPCSKGFEGNAYMYMPVAEFVLELYAQSYLPGQDQSSFSQELENIADSIQEKNPRSALILYLSTAVLREATSDQLKQKIMQLAQQVNVNKEGITEILHRYLDASTGSNSVDLMEEYLCSAALNNYIQENVVNNLPKVFATGIIAKIRRWFLGDESTEIIQQTVTSLREYVSGFVVDHPKACLNALSELRLKFNSSAELDQEIKGMIQEIITSLDPKTSFVLIQELIQEWVNENHFKTGCWGLTGVGEEGRKIPHGVAELLQAENLPALKTTAAIKQNQYSLFRKQDTQKLYEQFSEQPAPELN